MKSSGGSQVHIGMHVGEDWYTYLCTYDDHPPILDISIGSAMIALSITDRQVSTPAVEFARDLARQAAKFAAEVERMHGCQPDGNASQGGAEEGEAA